MVMMLLCRAYQVQVVYKMSMSGFRKVFSNEINVLKWYLEILWVSLV